MKIPPILLSWIVPHQQAWYSPVVPPICLVMMWKRWETCNNCHCHENLISFLYLICTSFSPPPCLVLVLVLVFVLLDVYHGRRLRLYSLCLVLQQCLRWSNVRSCSHRIMHRRITWWWQWIQCHVYSWCSDVRSYRHVLFQYRLLRWLQNSLGGPIHWLRKSKYPEWHFQLCEMVVSSLRVMN